MSGVPPASYDPRSSVYSVTGTKREPTLQGNLQAIGVSAASSAVIVGTAPWTLRASDFVFREVNKKTRFLLPRLGPLPEGVTHAQALRANRAAEAELMATNYAKRRALPLVKRAIVLGLTAAGVTSVDLLGERGLRSLGVPDAAANVTTGAALLAAGGTALRYTRRPEIAVRARALPHAAAFITTAVGLSTLATGAVQFGHDHSGEHSNTVATAASAALLVAGFAAAILGKRLARSGKQVGHEVMDAGLAVTGAGYLGTMVGLAGGSAELERRNRERTS